LKKQPVYFGFIPFLELGHIMRKSIIEKATRLYDEVVDAVLENLRNPVTAPRLHPGETRVMVRDIKGEEYYGDFISHDDGVSTVLLDDGSEIKTREFVYPDSQRLTRRA
jgi:hypothetical protein